MDLNFFVKRSRWFCILFLATSFLLPMDLSAQEVDRITPLLDTIRQRDSTGAAIAVQSLASPLTVNETSAVVEAIQYIAPDKSWLPVLHSLVEKNPENAQFLFQLARVYWRTGDEEHTMQYSRDAYKLGSDQPDILYGIAALAYSVNQFDDAKTWINRLLEIRPNHVDANFLSGSIASKQGDLTNAQSILEEVVVQQPRHALAHFELGKIYNRLNLSSNAEEHIRTAIQEQPFFDEAYNALIVALARQNKQKELAEMREISKRLAAWDEAKMNRMNYSFRHPNDISDHEADELAVELCLVRREDMAFKYLEQRWKIGKLTDPQRILLARLKFNQAQYPQSLSLLNEIKRKEMIESEPYAIFKAWSLFYLGQATQSREYFNQVFSKYPNSTYLQELGKALQGAPTTQEAAPAATKDASSETSSASEKPAGPFFFVDATEKSGLKAFKHTLGHPDKPWITDAMGSGVAVADYDNDGDDDIYFVNGRPELMTPDSRYKNALFRNNGDGTFTDVTDAAGVGDTGFGMCAVFGDVDNDGQKDLFVGNIGPDALYRNNGDGTFALATEQAGLANPGYAAATAFADIDRDGDLDLYVGDYVDFKPEKHGEMRTDYFGAKVFVGPLAIEPQKHHLYLNDGKGVFTDRSDAAGINVGAGRAMGVVFFYLDQDNLLDIYAANDSTYNYVLRNKGDGTFEDVSYTSGGAFNENGVEGASMGVASGDLNNDGFLDIYITSYEKQSDIYYTNDGFGNLMDTTSHVGLVGYSRMLITWGQNLCDFDEDGRLDIFTANGHLYPQVDSLNLGRQYNQGVSFYWNRGDTFENVSAQSVSKDYKPTNGRGSALIDYDQDGDMDIVVNCIDSTPLLLENRSPRHKWLQVNVDAPSAIQYGLRVVAYKDEQQWTRMIDGGSGYLSQNTSLLHFGFGDIDSLDKLVIYWPDREPQALASPPLNSRIKVAYKPKEESK